MHNIQIKQGPGIPQKLLILYVSKSDTMKRILYCAIPVLGVLIYSCNQSPATRIAGNYEGHYNRDTLVIGTASINVVEVNQLTVNFGVDLENDPDFTLNGVQVQSDTSFIELVYDGLEGEMTGTILNTHMMWTLMTPTDTITFDGTKLN
jgi:hypothetical protein